MKKIFSSIVAAGVLAVALCGCSKHTTKVSSSGAYSNFEVTCLGVEGDGSQTLRAWGKGTSKGDAIEQAKKNAVIAVLFKGIRGTGECNTKPLVLEVNARERYAEYFNPFFADGGEYKKFAHEDKGNEASRLESKGTSINNWGVIVTVDREGLRRQLEKDGVLRPGTRN